MTPHGESRLNCPECGVSNRSGNVSCFLCGHEFERGRLTPDARDGDGDAARSSAASPSASLTNPYAIGVKEFPRASGHGFRLSSLLLVIALIAVCLGVTKEAPGLGVPLAIVSSIALTRTMLVSNSSEGGKQPLSVADKVAVFFATVGMAVVVVICVLIALFATCYAIIAVAFVNSEANPAWVFGIPVVLLVAAGLFWGALLLLRRLRGMHSIRRDEPAPEGGRRPPP